ncbi:hypothetical protein C8Q80DRAFT_1268028 [Daedaleopsis nitida]|nr:hypothetical protein C8Q80DRAFT_1268028 [Daedaleopsis nitida]
MKYQIFAHLSVLQGLNIFWFFMISRLAYRAVIGARLSDLREDEEEDVDKPELHVVNDE